MLSKIFKGNSSKTLLALTLILVAIGIIMVFEASSIIAGTSKGCGYDFLYYLKREIARVVLGFILLFATAHFHYKKWGKISIPLLILSLFLLSALLIFNSDGNASTNGVKRWFSVLGWSFQPSELAKFALILFLASKLAKVGDFGGGFFSDFLPLIAIVALFVGLIALQPNYGIALAVLFTSMFILFVGKVKSKHLITILSLGIIGFSILIYSFL